VRVRSLKQRTDAPQPFGWEGCNVQTNAEIAPAAHRRHILSAEAGIEEGCGQGFYEYVRGQFGKLIPAFGIENHGLAIEKSYDLICRESLAIPRGSRAPNFSRINEDGTPFQFSVALSAGRNPTLQFLGEAAIPGSSAAERLRLSRDRVEALAALFDAGPALSQAQWLLDAIVPCGDPDLMADHSGAIWIGASFSPEKAPTLKVYLNVKWGDETRRWSKLNALASHFSAAAQWRGLIRQMNGAMEPLGIALSFNRNRPPSGRIYLGAYGKPIAFYEEIARSLGDASFYRNLRHYSIRLLREDYPYPTPSAVCSFGFDEIGAGIDYKLELCGHCLFASDLQAKERCLDGIDCLEMDARPYLDMLEVVGEGRLDENKPRVHSYLGLGAKRGVPYCTFYFKPSLGLS
jgi:hypothetical protein